MNTSNPTARSWIYSTKEEVCVKCNEREEKNSHIYFLLSLSLSLPLILCNQALWPHVRMFSFTLLVRKMQKISISPFLLRVCLDYWLHDTNLFVYCHRNTLTHSPKKMKKQTNERTKNESRMCVLARENAQVFFSLLYTVQVSQLSSLLL